MSAKHLCYPVVSMLTQQGESAPEHFNNLAVVTNPCYSLFSFQACAFLKERKDLIWGPNMNFDADVNNLCTEEMDAIVGGGDIITNNLVENGVPYATSIGPVVFNGLVFATNTLPNKVESATHTAVTTVSNAVGNATNWISSWF